MTSNQEMSELLSVCPVVIISQKTPPLYLTAKTLRRFFCPKACKFQNYSLNLHSINNIAAYEY